MENKLEYTKFVERLDFAIETLEKKFPGLPREILAKEACEIARTLFVRSEIAYSAKKA